MLIEIEFQNGNPVTTEYDNMSDFYEKNPTFNDYLRKNIENTGYSYLKKGRIMIDTKHKSGHYFESLKNDAIKLNRVYKLNKILKGK